MPFWENCSFKGRNPIYSCTLEPMLGKIKNLLTNRVSLLLIAVHTTGLVIVYFWSAGREITSHTFYSQPTLFKVFAFLDFPSILVTAVLAWPFVSLSGIDQSSMPYTILSFAAFVLIATLQWALIGYGICRISDMIRSKKLR